MTHSVEHLLTILQCTVEEFGCNDGGCLSLENRCDEVRNCEDGSDEEACKLIRCQSYTLGYTILLNHTT